LVPFSEATLVPFSEATGQAGQAGQAQTYADVLLCGLRRVKECHCFAKKNLKEIKKYGKK